ncbi:GIY-YIG nuclease family protein [Variovorax sp. J22R133]|uniref:GIY-YIG nuclease family protein n=1 Tax=Variovorax brevis TaxID=3053503 RepID=UPI002576CBCC|nr:GIY-YIG nuclease family protein [Variovorax sp. J22R133]MDM0111355.1 GIY-YIG nuclease family protein [Variovorax sp. J22R133]
MAMTNKRALKKQYLEKMVPAGVFMIRNKINHFVYIGGSTNVEGAMNRHRFELKLRRHRNNELMRDWIAHGADSFDFEVIDLLKERDDPLLDYKAELDELIEMWRQEHQSYGERGYNRLKSSVVRAPLNEAERASHLENDK